MENLIILVTINDIWATEENAIIFLMSVWNIHMTLAVTLPTQDHTKKNWLRGKKIIGVTWKKRIIPYLPSFSKIAASTIDPTTGASTWAFGSHICNEYRGSFTMNAIKKEMAHTWVKKYIVNEV